MVLAQRLDRLKQISGINSLILQHNRAMDISETIELDSRQAWRDWLAEYGQEKQEIWLVIYKSGSGKRSLSMREAQEEGVCFGWVDSFLKPLDAERYALRFTPRRKQSRWGQANRARALKMLQAGKMTPAGMAQLPPDLIQAWEEMNAG